MKKKNATHKDENITKKHKKQEHNLNTPQTSNNKKKQINIIKK